MPYKAVTFETLKKLLPALSDIAINTLLQKCKDDKNLNTHIFKCISKETYKANKDIKPEGIQAYITLDKLEPYKNIPFYEDKVIFNLIARGLDTNTFLSIFNECSDDLFISPKYKEVWKAIKTLKKKIKIYI